jgi:hypothetical protein
VKIVDISRFIDIIEECKRARKRSPGRFAKSKDKIVDEEEMSVSMLNPGAPIDNLECGDTYATGDFRIPTIIGKVQKRKKK